jgi:hypothetical protein
MKIYKDFVEFYETAVKNLYIMKQQRLDGKEKGSNSKEFARFRYRYKTWKVNNDTNVEPLREAYLAFKQQIDPFKLSQTVKGTTCLVLKNDEGEQKQLLIHSVKD